MNAASIFLCCFSYFFLFFGISFENVCSLNFHIYYSICTVYIFVYCWTWPYNNGMEIRVGLIIIMVNTSCALHFIPYRSLGMKKESHLFVLLDLETLLTFLPFYFRNELISGRLIKHLITFGSTSYIMRWSFRCWFVKYAQYERMPFYWWSLKFNRCNKSNHVFHKNRKFIGNFMITRSIGFRLNQHQGECIVDVYSKTSKGFNLWYFNVHLVSVSWCILIN